MGSGRSRRRCRGRARRLCHVGRGAFERQGPRRRRRLRRGDCGEVRPAAVRLQPRRRAGRAEPGLRVVPDLQPRRRRGAPAAGHHHVLRRTAKPARRDDRARHGELDRRREEDRQARRRARDPLRQARPVARRRADVRKHPGPEAGACRRPDPAGLEGERGNRRPVQADRGDARRRRLRDHDPRGAVPLPARALRARERRRVVPQEGQAEVQGPRPRRQPGRHLEGGRCSRRPGPSSTAACSSTAASTRRSRSTRRRGR